MNNIRFLPTELESVVGTEKIDFSVFAKRNKPIGQSIGLILFGTFWSAFTSIFVIAFFGPLLKEGEVHFTTNDIPTVGSWENFQPMLNYWTFCFDRNRNVILGFLFTFSKGRIFCWDSK